MKLPTPYKCDYCGKQKGDANHWWLSFLGDGMMYLRPWHNVTADDPGVEHICGQECATKAMAKWMEAQ